MNKQYKKLKRTPLMIAVVVGIFVALIQLSTFVFAPNPEQDSWGKILLPVAETISANDILIIGETQDIASGQYIWIVVEKPGKLLCQPLKRVLRNTRFRTTIRIENTQDPTSLSIYVVDEMSHSTWREWIKNKPSKGVPIPSDKRRLDSVALTFKS